jgi:hypothetical protein
MPVHVIATMPTKFKGRKRRKQEAQANIDDTFSDARNSRAPLSAAAVQRVLSPSRGQSADPLEIDIGNRGNEDASDC